MNFLLWNYSKKHKRQRSNVQVLNLTTVELREIGLCDAFDFFKCHGARHYNDRYRKSPIISGKG